MRPDLVSVDQRRCEQVDIDPSESHTLKGSGLNQSAYLIVPGNSSLWQRIKVAEDAPPLSEISTGKLTDHKWVASHETVQQ